MSKSKWRNLELIDAVILFGLGLCGLSFLVITALLLMPELLGILAQWVDAGAVHLAVAETISALFMFGGIGLGGALMYVCAYRALGSISVWERQQDARQQSDS